MTSWEHRRKWEPQGRGTEGRNSPTEGFWVFKRCVGKGEPEGRGEGRRAPRDEMSPEPRHGEQGVSSGHLTNVLSQPGVVFPSTPQCRGLQPFNRDSRRWREFKDRAGVESKPTA